MMTPRQERFVAEYLVDLNGTQAAIRAGYSAKTADTEGSRLLKKPEVAAAVEDGKARLAAACELRAEWVIHRLKSVAERCMQAEPVMVYDREGREMVHATDDKGRGLYTFDSKGANGALKLLGDHLGLYTKKVEHSGALSVALNGGLADV